MSADCGKLKNSNCFRCMHKGDFPKFGHISHNSPVNKELGNLCFGSVLFIKCELQALICDAVEN